MQAALRAEPGWFLVGPKLAGAMTDPCRSRILMELSVRPMSPSEFSEKVGGELSYIARCFRQLAEWGYVEVVEERPGQRRGASVEHVYRGIQRAHFDTSAWTQVPRSDRDAISRSVLGSYFTRITEAIEAGTFDAELDRHLSWDGVALDRIAWAELNARLDQFLNWLSELEVQASKRFRLSDSERIPTTVGLASFRSPQPASVLLQAPRRHTSTELAPPESSFVITPKTAKALSNKWRSRILMELNARPLSPSQFVEEIGGSMTHIARCFRQLADWGFVEVVKERKGGRHGGGTEKIYRNTQRAYFDTATWEKLPRFLRNEISKAFLGSYFERIAEAIDAGTFDQEADRHLSWKPIVIDRTAWKEIAKGLDGILEWLPELESESTQRIEGRIDDLIPTIVGLASFRSPGEAKGARIT